MEESYEDNYVGHYRVNILLQDVSDPLKSEGIELAFMTIK